MLKALILGGAGFIGFSLAKFLIKKNISVDLLDSFSRGKQDKDLLDFIDNDNKKIIQANLRDANIVNKVNDNYDFIFHFAALLGVENVIKNPLMVLDHNTNLTLNALNIAKKQKALKAVIFSSTSEVYAGTLEHNLLKIPSNEDSMIILPKLNSPRTSYMLSKLYGEALFIHSGLPYIILRPHNIFGPRMGMSHVVPQLFKKVYTNSENNYLEVYSSEHTRTFCFIEIAIQQIYKLIMNNKAINNTFNIGVEKPEIKINELAKKIITLSNKSLNIKEMPNAEGSPNRRCPSMKKTYEYIEGIENKPLEEGLSITRDWYLKNNYFN